MDFAVGRSEGVPGFAAGIEHGVVGVEDAVREVALAQVLPDILDGIEFGAHRRQGHEPDVFGELQLGGGVPAGAVEDEHGVGAGAT